MLHPDGAAVARKVLTGDPLAHEADLVCADVLVRDEDVQRVRAGKHLVEQHIGLSDLLAGGERPVGADAFRLQAAAGIGIGDGGVLEAARRDETPEPRDRGRDYLHHAHDAVVRSHDRGRRHTYAEGADIDFLRLIAGDDVLDHIARDNDAWVGAGLAVRLGDMLPDKAGRAGDGVHIEELKRL